MSRKLKGVALLLGISLILLVALTAMAQVTCSCHEKKDFSWYGESGATRNPVYDEQKGGDWWMPESAPQGQENTQWGNRGYVFVGKQKAAVAAKPCPAPAPAPAPKEKIVYVDKPVEKIVYKDRIVEKPVEKIVYRDKPVEKIVQKTDVINLQDVYFACDSSALSSLAVATLKENAKVLNANPAVKVVLVGSASPEGGSDYNLKLSERRITSVKDYMVSKEGIAAARLATDAKGAVPAEKPAWPFARKVGFAVAK